MQRDHDICTEIEALIDVSHGDAITLGEIIHRLRERGFGMLMMLLVLPNCVPIPVPPGTSTVFSIPLIFLAAQMLYGRKEPWIPQRLAEKKIRLHYLRRMAAAVLPRLRYMQKFIAPRFAFASSKAGERLVGLCWLLLALSIAVPLPMTNFLPGMGILVSAFGLLNRDGYIMLAGLAIGMLGLLLTTSVLVLGSAAILALLG